jgi:glutamate dehydrogenase (NAD(P)+)
VIGQGIYSPGMDMNCGPRELRAIHRGAGIELGEITDTSWFTAMSVFHALQSTCASLEPPVARVGLAIEGFGSVARHLMDRLDPDRFRIHALATIRGGLVRESGFTPAELAAARDAHGDALVEHLEGERIDAAEVLATEVDVVMPSARVWSITPEVADRIRARAVVPIANAPYVAGTVESLHSRSVVCLPGYLSNCGGVLASSLADLGVAIPQVESALAGSYRAIVDGILRLARQQGRPATDIAETLARLHMPERARPVHRSLPRRVYERFIERRRPRALRATDALRGYEDRCRRVLEEIRQLERSA